jgi:glycosyltransferase involved in cell wall biosynthesis
MAGDTPLVSVLITTLNSARFIDATLESALRQTLTDFEVLVLDDGSTDDTVERVRRVRDPRVRAWEYPHRGAPAALNAGLALARGRYLALLDHDDLWLPAKLARHVDAFDAQPGAAATFSWSGLIDEHDRPIAVHPAHWHGAIGFRQLLEDYVIGPSSSLVMRRASVERAGGFDEQLPRCHDFDLTLRLAFAEPNGIVAVPDILTLYRRHAGQMSRDWRAMHSEWNAVVEKCRRFAPADTAAVEPRARGNINRYFAYLAYENGEFRDARRFVREAARHDPRSFLTDPRNWKITAASVAEAVLPALLHRRLEQMAGIRRD